MSEPADLERRARAFWRGERYPDAARLFRLAARRNPSDASAWRYAAAALWRCNRRDEAVATLGEALCHLPDDGSLWRDLAGALGPRADTAAALAAAEAAGDEPALDEAADWREVGVAALGALRRATPVDTCSARRIIAALGRLSPDLAFARLAEWLRDEEPTRRALAVPVAVELALAVPEQYAPLLAHCAGDPSVESTAALTATVAAKLAGPDGAALTKRLLADPDTRLRGLAIDALVATGDLAALQSRYLSAAFDEQMLLLGAFGRLGAFEDLAVGLYEADRRLRAEAARQLAALGDEPARSALAERLSIETDAGVREVIETTLAQAAVNVEPEVTVQTLDGVAEPGEDDDDQ